jgi:probable F420-dependent oxidoreductase
MDFALKLPMAELVQDPAVDRTRVVGTMAKALEAAGVSAALTSEHPAPSAEWLRNDPAAHDCLDPLTALAFVAGCTDRLKVFTNVLVLPYRNPFLTAKAAATLQIISGDRLLLGVGIGYQREEFEALGVRYGERGALMDEAIETIRQAWAGGPVVRQGRHFSAVGNEPRPVPRPAPPIWIGGGSDKAVERAAFRGDGWVPYFVVPTNDPTVRKSAVVSMDHFAEKVARLRELRDKAGRTGPFDLPVSPQFRPKKATRESAERFLDEAHQLAELGVNWVWTAFPSMSLETYLDFVAWFGEEIVAKFDQG